MIFLENGSSDRGAIPGSVLRPACVKAGLAGRDERSHV